MGFKSEESVREKRERVLEENEVLPPVKRLFLCVLFLSAASSGYNRTGRKSECGMLKLQRAAFVSTLENTFFSSVSATIDTILFFPIARFARCRQPITANG